MSALHNHVNRDRNLGFKFEDPKSLVGPINRSTGNIPPETAGVADFLGFCQVRLPAMQLAVKIPEFHDHVVKHVAEVRDFISSGGADPMTEVTFRQGIRACHETSKRLGNTA